MLAQATAALLALASTATAASPAAATPKACAKCKPDLQPMCNDYRLEPRFCNGAPPGAKKNVTGGIIAPTCCSDGTWVCVPTFVPPCGGGARPANRCAKGDTNYDSSSTTPYPLDALKGKCPVVAPGKNGTFYMALSPAKEERLLESALYLQDNGAVLYGDNGKFTSFMWQSPGSNKIQLSASKDLCLTVSSKGDNKVVTGPCGKARQWKTELKSKNASWLGPKGAIPQVHVRLVVDSKKEKCMQLAVANKTIPIVVGCADNGAPWLLADKY